MSAAESVRTSLNLSRRAALPSTGASRDPRRPRRYPRPFPRLIVGLQRERPDLARAVAFLAVLLEDRRHVLAVGGRVGGGLELGHRAADGGDVGAFTSLPFRRAVSRVLEVVAGGIGVAHAPLANWSSIRRDSGPGPWRRSRTPRASPWRRSCARAPCRSRTTGNFKLKSRAWALTSRRSSRGRRRRRPTSRASPGRLDQRAEASGCSYSRSGTPSSRRSDREPSLGAARSIC